MPGGKLISRKVFSLWFVLCVVILDMSDCPLAAPHVLEPSSYNRDIDVVTESSDGTSGELTTQLSRAC